MSPKPGYATTEFWLTLISQLIPILVLTGLLTPDDATGVQSGLETAVTTGFAFGQAIITLVTYVWGRVKVKTAG